MDCHDDERQSLVGAYLENTKSVSGKRGDQPSPVAELGKMLPGLRGMAIAPPRDPTAAAYLKLHREAQEKDVFVLDGVSLRIFTHESRVRLHLHRLLNSRLFEVAIMVIILASCVCLAVETPRQTSRLGESTTSVVLHYADIVFLSVFLVEALLKIIVLGLVVGPGTYLRNGWHLMDVLAIFVTALPLVYSRGFDVGFLRAIRALRVLRIVSRIPGARVVIVSLFRSARPVANVAMILLLIWIIFAVIAVQIFAGSFFSCRVVVEAGALLSSSAPALSPYLPEDACVAAGGRWVNAPHNFDDIFNALKSLYEVSSLEGWVDLMWLTIDANGAGRAPRPGASMSSGLFLVVFMFIGVFFSFSLLAAVIIHEFNLQSGMSSGTGSLTAEQSAWVTSSVRMTMLTPIGIAAVPPSRVLAWLHGVIHHRWFNAVMTVIVALNFLTLAVGHHGESERLRTVLMALEATFTAIYGAEAAAKLCVLGVRAYFSKFSNVSDFVVAVAAAASLIFDGVAWINILRILRSSRLLRWSKGSEALVAALTMSVNGLTNTCGLVALVIYIFAVAGVASFGKATGATAWGSAMGFGNFGSAVLVLITISTGEDWPTGASALSRTAAGGWLFFFFYLLIIFVLRKIFFATLIESFGVILDRPDLLINNRHFAEYRQGWSALDPTGTGWILATEVPRLVASIPPPLGTKGRPPAETRLIMLRLRVAVLSGMCHFSEVLTGLIARAHSGAVLPDTFFVVHKIRQRVLRRFPDLEMAYRVQRQPVFLDEASAVTTIARMWRAHAKARKTAAVSK